MGGSFDSPIPTPVSAGPKPSVRLHFSVCAVRPVARVCPQGHCRRFGWDSFCPVRKGSTPCSCSLNGSSSSLWQPDCPVHFQLLPGAFPGPCILESPRLFTTLAHWLASRSSHGFPKVLHGKWQKSVDYTQEKTPRILCGSSSLSQSQQTHPQINTYLGKGNYLSRPFIVHLSTSQLLAQFIHLFL